MKPLKQLKVISYVDGGPYTYEIRLGWYIVGPIINMVGKKSLVA